MQAPYAGITCRQTMQAHLRLLPIQVRQAPHEVPGPTTRYQPAKVRGTSLRRYAVPACEGKALRDAAIVAVPSLVMLPLLYPHS